MRLFYLTLVLAAGITMVMAEQASVEATNAAKGTTLES